MTTKKPQLRIEREPVISRLKTPREIHNYILTKILGIAIFLERNQDAQLEAANQLKIIQKTVSEILRTKTVLYDVNMDDDKIISQAQKIHETNTRICDEILDDFGYSNQEEALGETFADLASATDHANKAMGQLLDHMIYSIGTDWPSFINHPDFPLLFDLSELLASKRKPKNKTEEMLVAALEELDSNGFDNVTLLHGLLNQYYSK